MTALGVMQKALKGLETKNPPTKIKVVDGFTLT